MTVATLGLVLLIAMGVGAFWDILEPDAVKIKFNSPARATFTLLFGAANIWLFLLVVGASVATGIAVVAAYITLAVIGAFLSDR